MQKLLCNLHKHAPEWSFFQVFLVDCTATKCAVQFPIKPKHAATNRRSKNFLCAELT